MRLIEFRKGCGALLALAGTVAWLNTSAAPVVQFPFNEGSGTNITDSINGLQGMLLNVQNPETDIVSLTNNTPSGDANDRAIAIAGKAFLVAQDTNAPVLAFATNQAFTVETWVQLDPNVANPIEGIVTYGNAYKLGLRSAELAGEIVFTLYGKVDIRSGMSVFADGSWHHIAAAFEPAVGVTFYLDGVSAFVPDTNTVPAYVNNALVIGAERFNNNVTGNLDRLRIHSGLLTPEQLDNVPTEPKPVYENTVVAYNFNETAFPVQNAKEPLLPTISSLEFIGTPWTEDDPAAVANDFSLKFDGSARASVPVPEGIIPPETVDYTLEAWVKMPATLPTARSILYQYEGTPGFAFSINTDGTLHTTTFGKLDRTSTVKVPQDGQWHHVAVVHRNGVDFQFYLDGTLAQAIAYTQGPGTRNNPTITIGAAANGANAFFGQIDRIRISTTALTAPEMDAARVPGGPIFASSPTNVTLFAGQDVTLSASAVGNEPVTLYWQLREFGEDEPELIEGAMGGTLTFNDVTPAQQGYYSVIASNALGTATSLEAKLLVATDTNALMRVWALAPGDRPYLTSLTGDANTENLERGMAYNPVTDHVLVVARETSPVLKGIYILDAETGADVGTLSTNGIEGGTFILNKIGVADDGAIYAINFGSYSPTGTQTTIYRWANESAEPTIAFKGNPSPGLANQQWGKNFAVRGSGTNTQILLDTRTTLVGLLTTTNGADFTPTVLQTDAPADAFGLGIDFGLENRFWGINAAGGLYHMEFDAAAGTASVIRHIPEVDNLLAGIDIDLLKGRLAGIYMNSTGADTVQIYSLEHLFLTGGGTPTFSDTLLQLLDSEPLPTDNPNVNSSGNVAFGKDNMLFALDTNNGLVAYRLSGSTTNEPTLNVTQQNGQLQITWSDSSATLEATTELGPNANWSPVTVPAGATEYTTQATGTSRFFRLRK